MDLDGYKTIEEANKISCCVDRAKKCDAPDCMGWRVMSIHKENRVVALSEKEMASVKDERFKTRKIQVGYCGMAGKP